LKLETFIQRRLKNEPIAYILGRKEFYGLEFKVDKNVLIPRPETEMLVELASYNIKHTAWNKKNKLFVVDVGTGSGNIVISIAKAIDNFKFKILNLKFIGIDISSKALKIAKQNAKFHKVSKKIKFIQGSLLEPILKVKSQKSKVKSYIIIANLPYLSQKIYNSVPRDVKNYEPKSALYSSRHGLGHYKKLLKQIAEIKKNCSMLHVSCFMEISPEQKNPIKKAILTAFPQSHPIFFKDLAGKYRIALIKL
jgi:release factor glutamine methyltransferase